LNGLKQSAYYGEFRKNIVDFTGTQDVEEFTRLACDDTSAARLANDNAFILYPNPVENLLYFGLNDSTAHITMSGVAKCCTNKPERMQLT
jgi:hypothetical protein